MPRRPLHRNTFLLTVLLLAVGFLLCIGLRSIGPGSPPDLTEARDVFHLRDGVWTSAPHLRDGVEGLKLSGNGAVWTRAGSYLTLHRLDGDHWTSYGAADFGARPLWITGFALYGNDLWGATDKGVIHFDGTHWSLHKDSLKRKETAAAIAGPSGVWAVDVVGNLSHFDGATWSTQNVNAITHAMARGDIDEMQTPDLAVTGDGRVWIQWNGLWREDGDTWKEVLLPGVDLTSATLAGYDADRLWLAHPGDLIAVAADGTLAARYSHGSMGLAPNVRILKVAASAGRIWVAAQNSLVLFDGGRWQHLALPPETIGVRDVAQAPDGGIWVVGQKRDRIAVARWLALPLTACAIALTVIGVLIAMVMRSAAENRLDTEQGLLHAAGPLPGIDPEADRAEVARQARSLMWTLPLFLIAFPYLAWTTSRVAAAAVVIGAGACWWLWRRLRGVRRSSRYAQVLWKPAQGILALAILFFVSRWSPWGWINLFLGPVVGPLIGLLLAIVLLTLLVSGRDIVAELAARAAWQKGDYDLALRRLDRMSFGRPTCGILRLQGLTHALAGRHSDAERYLRLALARSAGSGKRVQRHLVGCLGEMLVEQDRFAEARPCLESSIALGDDLGSSRMDLAQMLLKQGAEPQKALELIEQALGMAKGSTARKFEGGRWANKAWALAVLGRRQEAEGAIEHALHSAAGTMPLLEAYRSWTIGMALLAMQQTARAIGHFRAAIDADPKGKYGLRAFEQLRQLEA